MDENHQDKTESKLITTDSKLWIPPLSPKDQEKLDHLHNNPKEAIIKRIGFSGQGFSKVVRLSVMVAVGCLMSKLRLSTFEKPCFSGKTVWDWLNLLGVFLIPIVIAAASIWFSAQPSVGQPSIEQPTLRQPSTAQPSGFPTVLPRRSITPSTSAMSTSSAHVDLFDPHKKEIAMELVSSAENSSLEWKAQYAYIEDIGDGRGYTGGIIGFCSGTGDMLAVIQYYTKLEPNNILAKYIPALQQVNGTAAHAGLDPTFVNDWKTAAKDPLFQQAQDYERDTIYFNPTVNQAKADGLRALGQFIYYDAMVMHGPGSDANSFGGIRQEAMSKAKTPAQGGDEVAYLNAFLNARKTVMLTEPAHSDTSRVDTEQRVFLQQGNLDLNSPLTWQVYGAKYTIPH